MSPTIFLALVIQVSDQVPLLSAKVSVLPSFSFFSLLDRSALSLPPLPPVGLPLSPFAPPMYLGSERASARVVVAPPPRELFNNAAALLVN